MDIAALTIAAERLWHGEQPWDGPLAFVDLDKTAAFPPEVVLPPCPVIGIGNPDHPLACHLDAVVEPPVAADAIVRQVLAVPNAAAVVVDLLRTLPLLPPDDGLTIESLAYAVLQGSAEHREWMSRRQAGGHDAPRDPGMVAIERHGGRLVVTLDHPASSNAIDRTMRDALYTAFALASVDAEIERVFLRATGRTFSLGAELGEFGITGDPATAHAIRCRTLPARMAARIADRMDVHVQGACVGSGLELAAWAGRFTASADAWFQLPELAMGILPGAGGCVSLVRRIGRQRTALLILSGKRLGVRHALNWGLVDAIVDDPTGDERGAHIG